MSGFPYSANPAMFAGRNAIVTGASSGIGRDVATMFASQGANVALVARRRKLLEALADELTEFGVGALPIVCDVIDQSQVNQAVDKACELAAAVVGRESELLAPLTGLSEDH